MPSPISLIIVQLAKFVPDEFLPDRYAYPLASPSNPGYPHPKPPPPPPPPPPVSSLILSITTLFCNSAISVVCDNLSREAETVEIPRYGTLNTRRMKIKTQGQVVREVKGFANTHNLSNNVRLPLTYAQIDYRHICSFCNPPRPSLAGIQAHHRCVHVERVEMEWEIEGDWDVNGVICGNGLGRLGCAWRGCGRGAVVEVEKLYRGRGGGVGAGAGATACREGMGADEEDEDGEDGGEMMVLGDHEDIITMDPMLPQDLDGTGNEDQVAGNSKRYVFKVEYHLQNGRKIARLVNATSSPNAEYCLSVNGRVEGDGVMDEGFLYLDEPLPSGVLGMGGVRVVKWVDEAENEKFWTRQEGGIAGIAKLEERRELERIYLEKEREDEERVKVEEEMRRRRRWGWMVWVVERRRWEGVRERKMAEEWKAKRSREEKRREVNRKLLDLDKWSDGCTFDDGGFEVAIVRAKKTSELTKSQLPILPASFPFPSVPNSQLPRNVKQHIFSIEYILTNEERTTRLITCTSSEKSPYRVFVKDCVENGGFLWIDEPLPMSAVWWELNGVRAAGNLRALGDDEMQEVVDDEVEMVRLEENRVRRIRGWGQMEEAVWKKIEKRIMGKGVGGMPRKMKNWKMGRGNVSGEKRRLRKMGEILRRGKREVVEARLRDLGAADADERCEAADEETESLRESVR